MFHFITVIGGVGLIKELKTPINHLFKKEGSLVFLIGKTFGHLSQSSFLQEVYSISDGPPPEVNLLNEKNNGEIILRCIKDNLFDSVHDVSSGGSIIALSEMCIGSDLGIKIEKPKKLSNIFEYFFGEDQSRYIVEISKTNLNKVKDIFKGNNIYYELIGNTQKKYFELTDEFKIDIKDLYNINKKWYYNY